MALSLRIVSYSLCEHMGIDACGAVGDGSGTRRRFSIAATAFALENLVSSKEEESFVIGVAVKLECGYLNGRVAA